MEYKLKETQYKVVSPGTIGVAQKISSAYEVENNSESGKEKSKLIYLLENKVMPCSQNQY